MESKLILFDFFGKIWQKSPYLRNKIIRIPDTVYIDDEPTEWYFTSKDGKIRKKLRENITKKNIFNHFLKKSRESDIIATFISTKKYSISARNKLNGDGDGFIERKWAKYSKKTQSGAENQKQEKENNSTIVIEYFDRKSLKNFLSHLPSNHQIVGILQSTIRPNGLYNSVIRVVWSPNITIFEKRANFKPFDDKAFPLKERMIIFDGPDYYSEQVNLNSKKAHDEITNIMEKLKLHFKGVMMNKGFPSNMIVYFKQDERNRIVMLFCSAIKFQGIDKNYRIRDKIEQGIHDQFSLPEDSKAQLTLIKPKCSGVNRFSICLDCMKKSTYSGLFKLKYSLIIKRYEAEKLKIQKKRRPNQLITKYDPEGNMILETKEYMLKNEEAIPRMFRKIYPEMKYEEYQENIQLQEFLDKNVMLCYECLIPYMNFYGQEGGDLVYNMKRTQQHKGRIYKVGDMDLFKLKTRKKKSRVRRPNKKKRRLSSKSTIGSKYFMMERRGLSEGRNHNQRHKHRHKDKDGETTAFPHTSESKNKINDIWKPKSSSMISITKRYKSFETTFGVMKDNPIRSRKQSAISRSRLRINSSNPMKSYYKVKHNRARSASNSFQIVRIQKRNKEKKLIGKVYKIQQEFVQKINSLVKNRDTLEKKKQIDNEKRAGFFKRKKTVRIN